jgi:dipeptidyl aminopeptidase/acylaminoacyl peptidase
VRDHDLWVRATETGAETRLTTDGQRDWAYATPIPNPRLMFAQNTDEPEQAAAVFWSPDSKRLLTYRMDTRAAGRLTMVENAPKDGIRPRSFGYIYPLAVDSVLPTAQLVLFNAENWQRMPVKAPLVEQYYYGGPFFSWMPDSRRIQFAEIDRGYTVARWYELDAETGTTRTMLQQQDTPYVDWYGRIASTLRGGHEAVIGSEADGWMHLYLYDLETGALEKRLTSGEWVVDDIEHIDEDQRVVYFTAGGREAGRDPYLRHLYRVGLDGRGFRLLTPENADHAVSFSPSGKYFVDTYSRVDAAPVSVLRRSNDGSVVVELERADISRLLATGWTPPVPFTAKARDGETDIYGLMWRPTNFDSTLKYPVVEQVYTGPHGFFVPKTFNAYRSTSQAIAELGFVSVMIDGMGTAKRSRAFHVASYQNVGEGTADHPGAIRQLAARHSYIDTSRVGIYGHSAGGYDAAHAILAYPDFYKVAVSSAGNHDNRMDKAVWNTQWMGWPVTKVYDEQSNITLAPRLEGKLFLMHGDVDDNVPISATLQLVAALIKANKDFDLLIMPGETHGSGGDPYFIRRRWDYFVRNLLGVEPPPQFDLSSPPARVSRSR